MTNPPRSIDAMSITRLCIERLPDELEAPQNIQGARYTLCLPPLPPTVHSAHDFLNLLRANPDAAMVTINTIVDMIQTLTGPISQPPVHQTPDPDPHPTP